MAETIWTGIFSRGWAAYHLDREHFLRMDMEAFRTALSR